MRKRCANHKAVGSEIDAKLARILVRRLTAQKRSLLRAIRVVLFDLKHCPPGAATGASLGAPHAEVVNSIARLQRAVKKNLPKPALWG